MHVNFGNKSLGCVKPKSFLAIFKNSLYVILKLNRYYYFFSLVSSHCSKSFIPSCTVIKVPSTKLNQINLKCDNPGTIHKKAPSSFEAGLLDILIVVLCL